ncbi:MAG: threonyl-tRNA synthetase editing domain-containing protein [Candidatus Heimdallarchaeota archaeon]
MRLLVFHVDSFKCSVTKKGRSKVVETPHSKTTEVEDALLVFTSVEKQDETNPEEVARRAVEELVRISHQLKVTPIVLHPFAHLFGVLSQPEIAVRVLKLTEAELHKRGFDVRRTPFGWFNTLELKAKSHPLSRIARRITAN